MTARFRSIRLRRRSTARSTRRVAIFASSTATEGGVEHCQGDLFASGIDVMTDWVADVFRDNGGIRARQNRLYKRNPNDIQYLKALSMIPKAWGV